MRTDNVNVGIKRHDVDDVHDENIVADEREVSGGSDNRKQQIVQHYMKAREKMQETKERVQEKFDQVKDMVSNSKMLLL